MIFNKSIKVAHVLIFLACAIFLYYLFIYKSNTTPVNYTKYKREIDSINVIIKQLKNKQKQLDSSIFKSNKKLDSISLQIGDTKKQIQKVKKEYNEKINNITNSTPSQLQQFFTDRYK